MPYLPQRRKDELDLNPKQTAINAGDLTYLLYVDSLHATNSRPDSMAREHIQECIDRYMPKHPWKLRYEDFAIVLGCLDSTVRELKRRRAQETAAVRAAIRIFTEDYYHNVVAPYEDQKINQNGDVL